MDVAGERDRAPFVGGVDDAEQRLGLGRRDRQQADVVDDDQVDADELADRLGDGVVGAMAAQQRRQGLERVPGDGLAPVDREVTERLDEM